MAEKRYQVVGECAHITYTDPNLGRINKLLHKPSVLPPGVDQDRIVHLLSVGLIAPFGDDEPATPVVPVIIEDGTGGDGTPPDGDAAEAAAKAAAEAAALAEARAAAKAKLPTDGSPPKGNASTEVWIEYAVAKGYDYEAAKGESRDDLVKLLTT